MARRLIGADASREAVSLLRRMPRAVDQIEALSAAYHSLNQDDQRLFQLRVMPEIATYPVVRKALSEFVIRRIQYKQKNGLLDPDDAIGRTAVSPPARSTGSKTPGLRSSSEQSAALALRAGRMASSRSVNAIDGQGPPTPKARSMKPFAGDESGDAKSKRRRASVTTVKTAKEEAEEADAKAGAVKGVRGVAAASSSVRSDASGGTGPAGAFEAVRQR